MNLVLFQPGELGQPLPATDLRAKHLQDILGLSEGDTFKAGIVDGGAGPLTVTSNTAAGWTFSGWEQLTQETVKPWPVLLIIGTPRPPTARRLLKDLTTLGVGELWFCSTDLGEKSYLQSSLWAKSEYVENLIEGAQQAGTTHLPAVKTFTSLHKALQTLPEGLSPLAFDVGRPAFRPQPGPLPAGGWVGCLGPERGWSDRERGLLERRGVIWQGLGPRILRTETAAVTVASQLLSAHFW